MSEGGGDGVEVDRVDELDCEGVGVFLERYGWGKIICLDCCVYLNVLIVGSRVVGGCFCG